MIAEAARPTDTPHTDEFHIHREAQGIVKELAEAYRDDVLVVSETLESLPEMFFTTTLGPNSKSAQSLLEAAIREQETLLAQIDQPVHALGTTADRQSLMQQYRDNAARVLNYLTNPTVSIAQFQINGETRTGYELLMGLDGLETFRFGYLLKLIDLGRSLGHDIPRAVSANLVWGDETPKDIRYNEIGPREVINLWLERKPPREALLQTVETVTHPQLKPIVYAFAQTVIANSHDHLTLTDAPAIGGGSTPREDLDQQVWDLMERDIAMHPYDLYFPPSKVRYRLNSEQRNGLYLNIANQIIQCGRLPQLWEGTWVWNGNQVTGTQLILDAYRHEMQHHGTLTAHREYQTTPIPEPAAQT